MFENRLDPKKLDELARGVLDKLPAGFQTLQQDMEKNCGQLCKPHWPKWSW